MKYNASLDMVAAGLTALRANKPVTASKYFAAAAAHVSVVSALSTIEASNAAAFKSATVRAAKATVQSSYAKRLRSSGTDSFGVPMSETGEELRIEPELHPSRDVQEADFTEDEDGGDLDMEDDLDADADGDIDSDDMTLEDDSEEDKDATQSKFVRAMRNIQAAKKATAKKKKPARK